MWWRNYSQTLFRKSAYFRINKLKFYSAYFHCMLKGDRNVLKLSCRSLNWHKAFLKYNKRSRTSLPVYFCAWFLNKHILWLNSINWQNIIVRLFISWDIGQRVYYNCILTRLRQPNFEINLIFVIKLFFYMTRKWRQNLKYLENEKSFYGELKSIFHHFLRAFIEAKKRFFLDSESPTLSCDKFESKAVPTSRYLIGNCFIEMRQRDKSELLIPRILESFSWMSHKVSFCSFF